jgi:hypothetical protein
MGGVQTCGGDATKKPLAILHRLSQSATSCDMQAVRGGGDMQDSRALSTGIVILRYLPAK